MSHLAVFLFGPPRIERGGELVKIGRRKAIALLAYLATADESHARDTLAMLLWPESIQARHNLRSDLSRLNKALGADWLKVEQDSLTLKRDSSIWVDVNRFYSLLAECGGHGHPADETCPACLVPLAEAVTLYRNDFMAGFTLRDSPLFDEWQFFQSERLRRDLSCALERLVCGHGEQREFESAIAYAQRWLALDPMHEMIHRYLMQLYALAGHRAAALQQYRECVRVLQQELGVLPQKETTWLYRAIQENRWSRPTSVTWHSFLTCSHNLPVQPMPFVGRRKELVEIDQLLNDPDCRLLTLFGPGGIGKTRLALQAAKAKVGTFSHGVRFVPLAALSSARLLALTIADALQFSLHGPADPRDQLLSYLREKHVLLVLDNFEHLLCSPLSPPTAGERERGTTLHAGRHGEDKEAQKLLADILSTAPGVKLMVTSRQRLNLRWEWPFEVQGLSFPQDDTVQTIQDYDAVRLFVQSAGRARPGFALTSKEVPLVAHICQFLEGLPLGIELAATWLVVLSCREIVQEMERNLAFLTTELQDMPERHRSLQAVFEPSWQLLSEEERSVFKRLSVFRGGFRREAAARVAGASLPLLLALVRKSFLRQNPAGRYEMLEVLRQYGEEKLRAVHQEEKETRDRHCEYYAAFLHHRQEHLRAERHKELVEEQEIENIRVGWQWAVVYTKVDAINKSLTGLSRFYEMQGWFREGEELLGRAMDALREEHSAIGAPDEEQEVLLGRILAQRGRFCQMLSRYEKASELLEVSLEIFRRLCVRREMAFALNELGSVEWRLGKHARAGQLYQESLTTRREIGDRRGIAICCHNLGNVAWRLGEYTEAKQLFQESLKISKEVGDRWNTANCLNGLGVAAWWLKEYEEVRRLFKQSLTIYREIGDRRNIATCLNNLGSVAQTLEDHAEAERLFRESLTMRKEIGDRRGAAECLTNLGRVAEVFGEYDKARRLCQQSLTILEETGDRWEMACCLNGLGFALCALDKYQEAERCFREALGTAMDIQAVPSALEALVGMGAVLMEKGEKGQAVELVAHVLGQSSVEKELKDRAERLLSELESQLFPQAFMAAQQAGKEKRLEDFVRVCGDPSGM